jgi:hypothetical protein
VRYTLTESIKIYKIALENKSKAKSASFWLEVERNQELPQRTADSLRNFWKNVEKKGLEKYMKDQLSTVTWYCHAFSSIPTVKLMWPIYEYPELINGSLERGLFELADIIPA